MFLPRCNSTFDRRSCPGRPARIARGRPCCTSRPEPVDLHGNYTHEETQGRAPTTGKPFGLPGMEWSYDGVNRSSGGDAV